MKFNEIVAPSMKELFISSIENMILSGKLKIGDKLPTEREMADQMKVSRTIVNLGLNELQSKGFIKVVPRHGTYVDDYIRNGKLDTLMSIINYNGGSFDRKTFYSLMEFRLINEGAGAYLAALNRTDEDIKRMEELYEEMISSDSIDDISDKLFEIHHVIFYATRNYIYPLVHNAFKNVSVVLTNTLFNYFGVEETNKAVKNIIELIKTKDADNAKLTMESLINMGIKKLEESYFK